MESLPRKWKCAAAKILRPGTLASAAIDRSGSISRIEPLPARLQPPATITTIEELILARIRLTRDPGPGRLNIVLSNGLWHECRPEHIDAKFHDLSLRLFA